jgi:tRNA(fMet)-specific endonuclease VapC
MTYLLDTNICIYLIRHKPIQVRQKFSAIPPGNIAISAISVAELQYGAEKSQQPLQNKTALGQFLLPLSVVDFDSGSALKYGQLRAELERAGTPIGSLDLWIASQALWLDAILVTNNEKEFKRVPNLQVENWAQH